MVNRAIRSANAQHGDSLSAEATIDRHTPGQVRIALREGGAGIARFVGFVVAVAAALYVLMPAARAHPAPLVYVVAVVLLWAGIARSAREEYIVDQTTRSLTARHVWLLGRREMKVSAQEVSLVRQVIGGPDDDRRLVELLGTHREVRLRLPRRVNTLMASDQRIIGRLVAEHLDVPLEAA
jgi:hypothetical protein